MVIFGSLVVLWTIIATLVIKANPHTDVGLVYLVILSVPTVLTTVFMVRNKKNLVGAGVFTNSVTSNLLGAVFFVDFFVLLTVYLLTFNLG